MYSLVTPSCSAAKTPLYRYRSCARSCRIPAKKCWKVCMFRLTPSFSSTMDLTSVSWREAWPCPCPPPCPAPCVCDVSVQSLSQSSCPWPPSWPSPWPPPWPSSWPPPWPSPWPEDGTSGSTTTKFTSPWPVCSVSIFAASKASIARSSPSGTSLGFLARLHSRMGTKALMPRMAPFVSSMWARSQASTLLSSNLSAKPTCCAGSLTAFSGRSRCNWVRKCLQSTTVRTPSILQNFFITSSFENVLTIGPGSAIPVVSIKIPSSMASGTPAAYLSSTFFTMFLIAITKSSRTVQHRHPLSNTVIDSTVSCLPTAWSKS
mmetsp:Transcript_150096/g.418190  ORF Transcript_150096/g.418190 Transcript_150096/m.418190 type:complete len:318 (-) Transcript_150096:40-993(-)